MRGAARPGHACAALRSGSRWDLTHLPLGRVRCPLDDEVDMRLKYLDIICVGGWLANASPVYRTVPRIRYLYSSARLISSAAFLGVHIMGLGIPRLGYKARSSSRTVLGMWMSESRGSCDPLPSASSVASCGATMPRPP